MSRKDNIKKYYSWPSGQKKIRSYEDWEAIFSNKEKLKNHKFSSQAEQEEFAWWCESSGNFSFCADPTAWQCEYLCDTCLNNLTDGCDVFHEDDRELEISLIHEAQSTAKCQFYIKKQPD